MKNSYKNFEITIVDDDPFSSELLMHQLKKKDLHISIQSSVLPYLDGQLPYPDILLLDIMMPQISGLDALKIIRDTKSFLELPIILISAKDEATDIVDGLKIGANDYLTKPINADVAAARIKIQLELTQLYRESLVTEQLHTASAMVTTYNHEINNPLSVAIGNLNRMKKKNNFEDFDEAMAALIRIRDIVKKIQRITEKNIEFTDYASKTKMIKIK